MFPLSICMAASPQRTVTVKIAHEQVWEWQLVSQIVQVTLCYRSIREYVNWAQGNKLYGGQQLADLYLLGYNFVTPYQNGSSTWWALYISARHIKCYVAFFFFFLKRNGYWARWVSWRQKAVGLRQLLSAVIFAELLLSQDSSTGWCTVQP